MPEFSEQFSRITGRDDARDKKKLLKQLRKNFPGSATEWIKDPRVHVERARVAPSDVDWENRESWRATHEPKRVAEKRDDIKRGDEKRAVMVDRPGHDDLFIADGHHHVEAYTQLIGKGKMPGGEKKFPAFVVKVPHTVGPWTVMHDRQKDGNG